MDYLSATSECVEHELFFSINYRNKLIKKSKNTLGPPDLCHILKKKPHQRVSKRVGFYHAVHGLRIESISSIAAYFARLLLTQPEQQSKKNKKKQWKIEALTFQSFNTFRREDLVVKLSLPNTLTCYTVDANGKEAVNPSDEFWVETFVSSFLRWNEMPRDSVCSTFFDHWLSVNLVDDHILDPQPKILEDAIRKIFHLGLKLGTTKIRTVPTLVSNKLVDGLRKYLFRQHRYRYSIELFTSLSESKNEPELLWIVAKALRKQGKVKKCEKILEKGLESRPSSFLLRREYIKAMLALGKFKNAIKSVERLERLVPFMPQTFILSAKISFANQNLNRTLIALNKCPFVKPSSMQKSTSLNALSLGKGNNVVTQNSSNSLSGLGNEDSMLLVDRITWWNGCKIRVGSRDISDELDDLYLKEGEKYSWRRRNNNHNRQYSTTDIPNYMNNSNFNQNNNNNNNTNFHNFNNDRQTNYQNSTTNDNIRREFSTGNYDNFFNLGNRQRRLSLRKTNKKRGSDDLSRIGLELFVRKNTDNFPILSGITLKIYQILSQFLSKVNWERINELRDEVFLENVRDSGVKKGIIKYELGKEILNNEEWDKLEKEIQAEKTSNETFNEEWELKELNQRKQYENEMLKSLESLEYENENGNNKNHSFNFNNGNGNNKGYYADEDGNYSSSCDTDDFDEMNIIINQLNKLKKKKNNNNNNNNDDDDDQIEKETEKETETEKKKEKEKEFKYLKSESESGSEDFDYRKFQNKKPKNKEEKEIKNLKIGYQAIDEKINENKKQNTKELLNSSINKKNQKKKTVYSISSSSSSENVNNNNNNNTNNNNNKNKKRKNGFGSHLKKAGWVVQKAPEPEIISEWECFPYQQWLQEILKKIYHDSSTLSVLQLEDRNLENSGLSNERTDNEWEQIGQLSKRLKNTDMAERAFLMSINSNGREDIDEIEITVKKTDSMVNLIKIRTEKKQFLKAIQFCNIMYNFIDYPKKKIQNCLPQSTFFEFREACFYLICKLMFVKGASYIDNCFTNFSQIIEDFEKKNSNNNSNDFDNNKNNNKKNKKKKKKRKKKKKKKRKTKTRSNTS
ncbi:bud site selection protein [Anaeramoeba flamelloides]|uniref:Bud site selection protein n=1 Tax=Anaeramoeba flamelloides TaxID=1746091 RepID=A0ABQ8YAV6_9EUKA|nr:bud site selection protein [Anaeramoeba flamelloides]